MYNAFCKISVCAHYLQHLMYKKLDTPSTAKLKLQFSIVENVYVKNL